MREHGRNVDAAPLAEVLAAGETAKTAYYRDRMRDVPGVYKGIYKRVVMLLDAAGADSLAEEELGAVMHAAGVDPAGAAYADWLRAAIHWGVLAPTPDSTERYCVPIPSLATHLLHLEVTPSPAPRTDSSPPAGAPPPP